MDECGEEDEWTDGQITEYGIQRQMEGEVEHEKEMPRLTPECCLRLSTIILMNRQEDSDRCVYSMWGIHIHDAASRLCLSLIFATLLHLALVTEK